MALSVSDSSPRSSFRPADFAARQVDDGPAQPGALHLPRPAERAPQHGLDAGQQLAGRERLDDVVVGPHLQAADAVVLAAAGREDDDRQRRPRAPHLGQHFQPVAPRQHQIEQHQIDADAHGLFQTADAVAGLGRLVAGRPQGVAHAAADGLFVLDHHDTSRLHGRLKQGGSRCIEHEGRKGWNASQCTRRLGGSAFVCDRRWKRCYCNRESPAPV